MGGSGERGGKTIKTSIGRDAMVKGEIQRFGGLWDGVKQDAVRRHGMELWWADGKNRDIVDIVG